MEEGKGKGGFGVKEFVKMAVWQAVFCKVFKEKQ